MDNNKRKRASSSSSAAAADQPPPDGVLSVLLSENLLECSICNNPLTIPVFQCVNGHILCSSCCKRVNRTCPSCSKKIGHIRCLAIESVLESIKVSCSYKIHGCPEEFPYSSKLSHEMTCSYIPCGCPFKDCAFVGSQRELSLHLNTVHISSVLRLRLDNACKFSMSMAEEFVVFREEVGGTLFVLNKFDRMSLNFIDGPNVSKGDRFSYVLVVRGKDSSCLRFQSLANGFEKSSDDGFIQVPSYLFDHDGCLRMELCIWSKGASCGDIAGGIVC